MFDVFSVSYSLGQSVKNICMLNMFKFYMFSSCHSLGQSVTGRALFTFLAYTSETELLTENFIRLEYFCVKHVNV